MAGKSNDIVKVSSLNPGDFFIGTTGNLYLVVWRGVPFSDMSVEEGMVTVVNLDSPNYTPFYVTMYEGDADVIKVDGKVVRNGKKAKVEVK